MKASMEAATIEQTLPPRRRRLVFGRAAKALTAVLILALGFIGGVEVEKQQGGAASSSAGAAGASAAFGARNGGGFPGAGGAAGDFTAGTVANKKGRYIYLKDSNGTLIRVKVTSNSTITRNAKSDTAAIHPGDTVLAQGSKGKDGTVTATSVRATAQGVTGGGGFGGGGGAFLGGGGAPGGSARGSSSGG